MEVHLVTFLSAQEARHSRGFLRLALESQMQEREPAGVAQPDRAKGYTLCCATALPSAWPYSCAAQLLTYSQ